jgi:hypothetical protein
MNRKIVEYFTLDSNHVDDLGSEVEDYIKQGYQPYGNQYVIRFVHPTMLTCVDQFFQPMVKYDD